MGMQPPKIDPRSMAEIVDQTEGLAQYYTRGHGHWQPRPDSEPDAGGALIRIFARMVGVLQDRINRIPDKNFLAFLDLIGARLLPPQAARVPLTFLLAPGATSDAFVPARTVVATAPTDGSAEVQFETENALAVTPSRLVAAFSHDPGEDKYADVTDIVNGVREQAFPVFGGDWRLDQRIEHALYIADDELFTLPRPATFRITLIWKEAPPVAQGVNAEAWPVWSLWDGTTWVSVSSELAVGIGGPETAWNFTLSNLPIPESVAVNGTRARWLRLSVPGSPSTAKIGRIQLSGTSSKLLPDRALANGSPLDVSKDFLPFGERPRRGDALYLMSEALFSRAGAVVSIALTLEADAGSTSTTDPKLEWEMWDGNDWSSMSVVGFLSNFKNDVIIQPDQPTISGTVNFSVPDVTSPGTVAGASGHWLRVRLASGDYGSEPVYVPIDKDKKPIENTYILTQGGFSAPRILSLRLGCDYSARSPAACLSSNDFRYRDHTGATDFAPFQPSPEVDAALYLAFDRPFSNRPIRLYVQVQPEPAAAKTSSSVVWEYAVPPADPSKEAPEWKHLTVEDGTRGLTAPGTVTFLGPTDLGFVSMLGRTASWLRARRTGTSAPRARRILLNTVWASQSATTVDEVLGSSDGNPNQLFQTHGSPVLAGQRIEVRETNGLSEDERKAIVALEGDDAITPVDAPEGLSGDNWVRWHEVLDFYGSAPEDRHYVFDHMRGAVRFGDGRRGLIPPMGAGNVRAAIYRTGGGDHGNCPAGSITQLKSPLVSIAAVTHVDPADGGSDASSLDQVREHGPHILRHRGRCVAAQDYEDLALQASPKVARVLAIAPIFNAVGETWYEPSQPVTVLPKAIGAGTLEVVIVPRSRDTKPVPSPELLDQVKSFLQARCPAHVDPQVSGPDWIRVSVSATVAPASADVADGLAQAVVAALDAFLHPLSGGLEGQGWKFGREVHASDLYTLIEGVHGVDFVASLSFDAPYDDPPYNRYFKDLKPEQQARVLVYSGAHTVTLADVGREV